MNLRTALLAGILALAGTALHAEEFQMTIQGVACPQGSIFCDPSLSTTVPFTVTADLNSLQGMVSASGMFGVNTVDTLTGSAPLTNYTEIVGGHTIPVPNPSLSFNCFVSFSPSTYECNGGFGGVGYFDNETWMRTVTQPQFQAFKDPLASLLLLSPSTACSNGGVSDFCEDGTFMFGGKVTFTPVPTPAPLLLFLAGLIGLLLSRRREWPGTGANDPMLSPSSRSLA